MTTRIGRLTPGTTSERVRELLSYDAETGLLTWLLGALAGKAAGTKRKGYVVVKVDRRNYSAHRLAWLHVHGVWPRHQIDHINGVRNDNRLDNLRDVTVSVNAQNRRDGTGGSSRFLGVSWHQDKRRWRAGIQVNGKSTHIGRFKTEEEAYAAYLKAKREIHPGGML